MIAGIELRRFSTPIILFAIMLAVALVTVLRGDVVFERVVTIMFVNLLLAVALQVFQGNSGLGNFGQYAFVTIGAYSSIWFSLTQKQKKVALPDMPRDWWLYKQTYGFIPSILMAVLITTVVGAVVGIAFVRLRGASFTIATFAFLIVINRIALQWSELTRGAKTVLGIPKYTGLWEAFWWSVLGMIVAFLFKESALGLKLRASREDEDAAATLGVNAALMQWVAWTIAVALSAVGGALWAHFIQQFSPHNFYLKETFLIVAMLIIGGSGSVSGAVIGAIAVAMTQEGLRQVENWVNIERSHGGAITTIIPFQLVGFTEIVTAVAIISILIVRPSGLTGGRELIWPRKWDRKTPPGLMKSSTDLAPVIETIDIVEESHMTVTMNATELLQRDARYIADAIKIRYFPMALASGDGPYLIDVDGNRRLDFGAGWALAGLGYSNQRVREAIKRQIDQTTFGTLLSGANIPATDLAQKLVEMTPGDFEKKVWFGLSGSDAAEAATRLIMRSTGRRRLISFVGSWHGTHDTTMSLSAHPSLNEYIGGANVIKVPYPNPYRNPFGGDSTNITDQCLDFVENYLFKTIYPPSDIAAVFAEAVQADGGDVVPPPDFMPKLRALCDRHGILLVMDEIKIGMGRTGKNFGFEHGGIAADLVLLGKSLGGGLPLSAIVGRKEIMDSGTGIAVFTSSGNSTCCAAGLAVIEEIEQEGLVQQAAENGAYMNQCLQQTLNRHEIVGDQRGLGLIAGIELVTHRASKEPNQPAAAKIVYRAFELGLVIYYAGMWGNALEVTPPLTITRTQIEEGVSILDQAIEDVMAGRVSDEAVAQFAGW